MCNYSLNNQICRLKWQTLALACQDLKQNQNISNVTTLGTFAPAECT